jgi:hypothetical protein
MEKRDVLKLIQEWGIKENDGGYEFNYVKLRNFVMSQCTPSITIINKTVLVKKKERR